MRELFLNCCGYICTALTLISYVPQLIKILRTKHADDISVGSWLLWVIGASIWEAYALVDGGAGIIVAQTTELLMILTTLIATLKYRNSRNEKANDEEKQQQ